MSAGDFFIGLGFVLFAAISCLLITLHQHWLIWVAAGAAGACFLVAALLSGDRRGPDSQP